jgi:glycine oxidase
VTAIRTATTDYPVDAVVITAGLGSATLGPTLSTQIPLGPVLGQGIRVRTSKPLGTPDFQPVINHQDVHLVPLRGQEYGVAATVEFPPDAETAPQADAAQLEAMWQTAVAYCPALAQAERVEQWQGLRPRPQGRPAPIIEPIAGYGNAWLATGHYRNGVFLAPATAQQIQTDLQAYLQGHESHLNPA